MRNQLKYLFVILLFIGCRTDNPAPLATFKEPQPNGKKNLSKFPNHLQANYQSENKSSILTVSDNLIIQNYNYEIKALKDSLDNSLILKGDMVFDKNTGAKYKVEINNDTIKYRDNHTDTIFKISNRGILKYFKGYYFLNTLNDDNSWNVQKLYLSKGILTIGSISDTAAINQLKELTQSDSDTASFSLTKKQFKSFVKSGSFTDAQKFMRLKKDKNN